MSSSSLFATLGAALHSISLRTFHNSLLNPNNAHILNPSAHGHTHGTKDIVNKPCDPDLIAFESNLSLQLHDLQCYPSFDGTLPSTSSHNHDFGITNVPWLCHAIQIVISTHASAEAFLPDLQNALSHGDTKWLHQYLDDNVKLLDVCASLRDAAHGIRAYQRHHVDLALLALDKPYIGEAQLRRANLELEKCKDTILKMRLVEDPCRRYMSRRLGRLDSTKSMLRRMGDRLHLQDSEDFASSHKGSFFSVSYAAQLIAMFTCGVLTSTLLPKQCPGGRTSSSTISVDGHFPWASSFNSLQHRVKEEIDKKKPNGVGLDELINTDMAVRSLKDKIEKSLSARTFHDLSDIRKSAQLLRESVVALDSSLSSLEVHVEDMFKVLVTSRNVLLDIYSRLVVLSPFLGHMS